MNIPLSVLAIAGNLWIWRVFSLNPQAATSILLATALTLLFIKRPSAKIGFFFLISMVLLAFFQLTTTNVQDLDYLDNDEQRVQQMRLREYPPVRVTLFGKTLWIPVAHWFEQRKEAITFYRLEENFFEAIDPNLYFFSNHPRERVGLEEFEKFLYITFPFFLWGLTRYLEEKRFLIIATAVPSLVLISMIGHSDPLGPFLLFPFISVSIYLGLEEGYRLLKKISWAGRMTMVVVFLFLFALVFIQTFSYAI